MGHGIVILEQWQENEQLIDQLLENKKISKVENREINYSKVSRELHYVVESDFFKEELRNHYYPTCKVIGGELIQCTRPLNVQDFEDAQKTMDTAKKKEVAIRGILSSLSYDVGSLEGVKCNLTKQLSEMTDLIKQKEHELSNINDQIANLDSEKIEKISSLVSNIIDILDGVELKGAGSTINSLYNDLDELKKISGNEL